MERPGCGGTPAGHGASQIVDGTGLLVRGSSRDPIAQDLVTLVTRTSGFTSLSIHSLLPLSPSAGRERQRSAGSIQLAWCLRVEPLWKKKNRMTIRTRRFVRLHSQSETR